MFKKLISHSLIYGLGPYLSKFIYIFLTPILTLYYTKEDYGIWNTIQAYYGFVSSLSILGMSFAFNYAFFHYGRRFFWKWNQYCGFLILWTVIYMVLLTVIIYIFIPDSAKENAVLVTFLMVVPSVFIGSASQIGPIYFQLQQRPKPVAIINIITICIIIPISYYTIVILKIGYMGFVWAFCITTLLTNVIYFFVLIKEKVIPVFTFKIDTLRQGLKLSSPNIPHYYSYFLLGGVDKVIMDRTQISTGNIGIYSQGFAMAGHFSSAVGAVHTALGPMIYDMLRKKQFLEIKIFVWKIQLLFWVFTVLICLWMKEIFYLLIKNDTVIAYPIAVVFVMALNHKPLYIAASCVLGYNGKVKNIWRVTFLAGCFALILNIILIPIYDYKIVCFIMFVAWQLFAFGLFFLKDYKESTKIDFKFKYIALVNFILLICIYPFIESSLLLKIILSLIVMMIGNYMFFSKFLKIIK